VPGADIRRLTLISADYGDRTAKMTEPLKTRPDHVLEDPGAKAVSGM